MTVYHKGLQIVAIVAGLTTVRATGLDAQGGPQARRGPAVPTAPAPAPAPEASSALSLALATELLQSLKGTWRYEVRFAGNFTGPADASGTRVFQPLFDDLRLEWTESLDSSAISSRGIVGFDPRSGKYYSTAVYSGGPGVELLTGSPDSAEPLIQFTPVTGAARDADSRGAESFTLRLIDGDHFTWAPLDRSLRAVFTRERETPTGADASGR